MKKRVSEKTKCYNFTLAEIHEGIKNRLFSVKEFTEDIIKHIESLEDQIKAWSYFDPDLLIEQAGLRDAELLNGDPEGRIFGVPVGVKDIFNTEDMPTGMGSPLWKGFTPGNDARVVFNLKQEGGLIAGKTVTAEFAVHEPGETRNPHNGEYYPGTSSSGSAAAVASGMVPVAIGTQTAGSIIRPASYCGIYGFKPSFGTIPRTGVLKTTDTLDQIGWFSRAIEDLEILFDTVRVKGRNHPFVYNTLDQRKENDNEFRKIAIIEHPNWGYAEDYAKDAFFNLVTELSNNSKFRLEKVKLPSEFYDAHKMHDVIYCKSLSYYFQEECKYVKFVSKILKNMIDKGRCFTTEDYGKAIKFQSDLAARLNEYFDTYDAFITLSTSGEAPKFESPYDKPDSCLIWSMCWAPVINLPVFKGPHNMPYGIQIIGRRYNDYSLLELGKKLKECGFIYDVGPVAVSGDSLRYRSTAEKI
ncbi:MAG: hypothetical protein A2Z72_08410 [Omnitrophica bacterium RBG_13_46_9]|nr:MAG: hypothetical protein A2Z72_08410 [Omnitrophica bacterium RBG_13_46_9]